MQIYANLGGDSGVARYITSPDSIAVGFKDGSLYVYTYSSAGEANIEHMKVLATTGQGLNGFISRVVRNRYASKSRWQ